jgi:hypothetical protein
MRAQKENNVKGTRAGTRIYCYISAGARFWSVWVLERARNRARGLATIYALWRLSAVRRRHRHLTTERALLAS